MIFDGIEIDLAQVMNCNGLELYSTSGRESVLGEEKKFCTMNLSLFGASHSRSVLQILSAG